jgi:hypothetical protein
LRVPDLEWIFSWSRIRHVYWWDFLALSKESLVCYLLFIKTCLLAHTVRSKKNVGFIFFPLVM